MFTCMLRCCVASTTLILPNLSEGADSDGEPTCGDKECPISAVTSNGRCWKKGAGKRGLKCDGIRMAFSFLIVLGLELRTLSTPGTTTYCFRNTVHERQWFLLIVSRRSFNEGTLLRLGLLSVSQKCSVRPYVGPCFMFPWRRVLFYNNTRVWFQTNSATAVKVWNEVSEYHAVSCFTMPVTVKTDMEKKAKRNTNL